MSQQPTTAQRNFAAEEQRLKRQRALAEMLMQTKSTMDPYQMAGGFVVPVSPMQGLADVGSKLAAALMMRSGDKKEAALAGDKAAAYGALLNRMNTDTPENAGNYLGELATLDPTAARELMTERLKAGFKPEEFSTTPQVFVGPDGKPVVAQFGNRGTRKDQAGLAPRDKLGVNEATGQLYDEYTGKGAGFLAGDPNKPFNYDQAGNVTGNGAYQAYEMGRARAGATQISTNILPNTVAGEIGKASIADLSSRRAAAGGLVDAISSSNQIMQLIDGGKIVTGPGTGAILALSNYLPVGGKDTQEKLANTRVLVSQMAKRVLANSSQLKGVLSETDMALVREASAGNVNLPASAIYRIAQADAMSAQRQLEMFNRDVGSLQQSLAAQGQGALPFDYSVQIPQIYQRPQPPQQGSTTRAGGPPRVTGIKRIK